MYKLEGHKPATSPGLGCRALGFRVVGFFGFRV